MIRASSGSRLASAWIGLAVVCAAALSPSVCVSQTRAPRSPLQLHQDKHRQLQTQLTAALTELAKTCDGKGLADAAAMIRERARPADLQSLDVAPLPDKVQPEVPADAPADERFWRTQLRHHQQEYAKELFLLARRVLGAGSASYAFALVREATLHDPDHKTCRRILGYVQQGDEWITPFSQSMLKRKYVWHDKFGWLLETQVDKYDKGERYFKGRWISAAQEQELRRDFKNAWEIRTEHFLVKTNHSHERGVEIAIALEQFHEFFFQVFAGCFLTSEQMQKLFEGTSVAGGARSAGFGKPYVVHYYRTREEYNQALVAKIPQVGITNGMYLSGDRIAYFFHNPQLVTNATLFHEATHQFLYEMTPRERAIAEKEQFWIIEGIACYMESFQFANGRFTLGNPNYVRFAAARERLLKDSYFLPLAKISAMGMKEFQNDPNIVKNYSEAAGLAHFFMHYDGGRYRDAVIEHLAQHYAPQARKKVPSLEELTGVPFAELDRQYHSFSRELQETTP